MLKAPEAQRVSWRSYYKIYSFISIGIQQETAWIIVKFFLQLCRDCCEARGKSHETMKP